jgi:hypothetical protein
MGPEAEPEPQQKEIAQHFVAQRPQRTVDHARDGPLVGVHARQVGHVAQTSQPVVEIDVRLGAAKVFGKRQRRSERRDDDDGDQHAEREPRVNAEQPVHCEARDVGAMVERARQQKTADDEEAVYAVKTDDVARPEESHERLGGLAARRDQISVRKDHRQGRRQAQAVEAGEMPGGCSAGSRFEPRAH